jgi:hypothetical protein
MHRRTRQIVVTAMLMACVLLSACADKAEQEEEGSGAATVEAVKGTELSRVTLTEDAAKRLDIQTGTVNASGAGDGTEIPYGAVLYDPAGKTWAFVNVGALTFVREAITIDHIEGDVVFLAAGPKVGTKIVKVGATELYGAEIGVGEDE